MTVTTCQRSRRLSGERSMSNLSKYFERHEEQAFVAKALLTTLCIILIRNLLAGLIPLLLLLFPFVFLVYIRLQAAAEGISTKSLLKEHITFIPVMRTEDIRKEEVAPWFTYLLISVNVYIFLGLQCTKMLPLDFITDNLLFLPRQPEAWNLLVSPFASMFLHGSGGHLWGNMTFLWMVGTVVERRVGHLRFLALYLLTGILGGLVFVLMEFVAHGKAGHALGASGAIAGIMGVFAVRCYFKSMIFPFPLLGILSLVIPLSIKVRLNSLVIIGLFFLADLAGGMDQLTGQSASMVGHWAHLGGMISGMLIAAFYLKLGESAVEERHLEIGLAASRATVGYGDGARSLAMVIEKNPDNWEAVLALARLKTKASATSEGAGLYEQAIRLLLAAKRPEIIDVFNEYYGKFLGKSFAGFDPELLYQISGVCRRSNDPSTLVRCLELILKHRDTSKELRSNVIYQMGAALEAMGNDEARGWYLKYLQEAPDSERTAVLMGKLGLTELPKPLPARSEHQAYQVREVEDYRLVSLHASAGTVPRCPKCGAVMVKRRAADGPHAGNFFLVCAEFPRCRTVNPFESANQQATPPQPQTPPRQSIPEPPARPTRGTGRYRLVFNGQIDLQHEHADVVRNLAALLKMEDGKAQSLFSGKRVVLKENLSREQADKARIVFETTGAVALIEEIQAEIPESELARIACPKCGKEQDPSATCSECGIIFDKYNAYLEQQERNRVTAAENEERRLDQERERYSSQFLDSYVWSRVAWTALIGLIPVLVMVYSFNAKYNRSYAPPGEGFSVDFPGSPQQQTDVVRDYTITTYVHRSDECEYYVGLCNFPQELGLDANELLDIVTSGILKQATLVSEEKGTVDGHPARYLRLESSGKEVRWKICLAGNRLFQVGVATNRDGANAREVEKFINSFHLQ